MLTQTNACCGCAKKVVSRSQKNKSKQWVNADYHFYYFSFEKKLFLYSRVATLGATPKLTFPRAANHPGAVTQKSSWRFRAVADRS